jgi:hypothetical protein
MKTVGNLGGISTDRLKTLPLYLASLVTCYHCLAAGAGRGQHRQHLQKTFATELEKPHAC